MDKEVARGLIALAVATDEPIGKMDELIEQMEDGEEKVRLRRRSETLWERSISTSSGRSKPSIPISIRTCSRQTMAT